LLKQKRLGQSAEALLCFYGNDCSVVFIFGLFILPHGEFTGAGESGLYSKARQNPTVENVPGGKNADKNQ